MIEFTIFAALAVAGLGWAMTVHPRYEHSKHSDAGAAPAGSDGGQGPPTGPAAPHATN